MSILIKGMEMPPNCFRCPLSVLNGERLYCEVTKDEVVRAKRASDCPLVELPPHGRLIDADVALKSEQPTNVSDEQWAETTLARCINNAPTIVEAEGEDG